MYINTPARLAPAMAGQLKNHKHASRSIGMPAGSNGNG
jgi:hypothetical protein